MASGLLIFPGAQPSRSRSGSIIAAELRWYINETTTPAVVYTDSALTIAHPFPIETDDAGRFPLIWADTADFFSVNWSTAAPDSQSSSYDNLSATTAVDVQLLDTMNILIGQAEDIYDNVIAANTGFTSTTTTEISAALGVQPFLTQSAKSYLPGTLVTITSAASTGTWVFGDIETYDITSGQATINVTSFDGSGSFSDGNISLSGPVGPQGVGVLNKASAAEIVTGTDDTKYVTPKGLVDSLARVSATVSGTQTPDCSNSKIFDWLLSGNITLAAPSATADGASIIFRIKQPPAGGPYTLTKDAAVKKGASLNITLSTGANKVDVLAAVVIGSTLEIYGFTGDVS